MSDGAQRQCAPSATGVDHAVAGAQAQLAADMVKLGKLRRLERRIPTCEYAQV